MTVYTEKPAVNLREELASLRNQGGYQEQQFYFDSLVTNGTFDADTNWIKGTDWSISGGVANHTTTSSAAIYQTQSVELGKRYQVSVDITFNGAGTAYWRLGNTTNLGTVMSTTQTNTQVLTAAATGAYIGIFTNANITIDNISVFEVDANDDVIHTMPKGWKPKDVFEDGLLQREGSAHDYEMVHDGFDYFVKPTVAPSATTQTCVIGVKA